MSKKYVHSFLAVILVFCLTVPVFAKEKNLTLYNRAGESFQTGMIYFNNLQYLAAVEHFRMALSVYPEYHMAREYLARSYKLAGFVDEALQEWQNLLEISPENPTVIEKINLIRYRYADLITLKPEFVFSDNLLSVGKSRFRFNNPASIALDKSNNIYVASFSSGKIVKYSPNGEGLAQKRPMLSSKMYGVCTYKNIVAATDFENDKIFLFDQQLRLKKSFGSAGSKAGQFHGPQGISFDQKGNIFVVDSGNHRIQKFNKNGKFIFSIGKKGIHNGELLSPTDVVIFDNKIYVSDTGNKRIICFDEYGNFLKKIESPELVTPRGINIYNSKYLMIADEKEGYYFENLSGNQDFWLSQKKPKNKRPLDIVSDRDGLLYCLDYEKDSISIYSTLAQKSSNLELEITSVDTKSYPMVAFYLNVRDRQGKPLYGLEKRNFSIIEDNAPITDFSINYLKDKKTGCDLVFCVDRSLEMAPFKTDLPLVADFILKKMHKDDHLKIYDYNTGYRTALSPDWSRLRALKALKNSKFSSGKETGKVLYNAIADLSKSPAKRGIILFTDGKITQNSFAQYSLNNVIDYAKEHFIPIYIISFGTKNSLLQKIASETNGALYRVSEINSITKIYEDIRQAEEYRYVLVYKTLRNIPQKNWWSEIKISLKYKGLIGTEWGGYFVP